MKRLPLILLFAGLLGSANAQEKAITKGDWGFDAGGSVGVMWFNSNIVKGSGVGATPAMIDFRVNYSPEEDMVIHAGISAGSVRDGSNVQGADSIPTVVTSSATSIYLGAAYNLVNQNRFVLHVGCGLGVSALYYEEKQDSLTAYFNAQGTTFRLNFGLRKYFNDWFGIYSNVLFVANPYALTEVYDGYEVITTWDHLDIEEVKLNLNGPALELGFTFNF